MFRLLYLVVLAAGVLWIVQTRPVWLDPTVTLEEPPRALAGGANWQRDAESRNDEMFRRIRIVALATVGVVIAGEVWCALAGRLKLFSRP